MKTLSQKAYITLLLFMCVFSASLSAISQNQNELVSGYIKNLNELWEVNHTKTFDKFNVEIRTI